MSAARSNSTSQGRATSRWAMALLGMAFVPLAIAQFQVNRQVSNPGAAASRGSVRYASPNAASAYTGSAYTARYDQTKAAVLPSEARMAAQRSGALPSELRANYNRMGPMSPSGSMSYIPPAQTFYNPQKSVAQGNYVDRSVNRNVASPIASPGASAYRAPGNPYATGAGMSGASAMSMGPVGQPMTYAPPAAGSVRYSPSASGSSLTSSSMLGSMPASGSVRYAK